MSVDSSTPYATDMVSFRILSMKKALPPCTGAGVAAGGQVGCNVASGVGDDCSTAAGEGRGVDESTLVVFGVGIGLISTKASPFSCCIDKAMPIMAAKIERAAMSAALVVV